MIFEQPIERLARLIDVREKIITGGHAVEVEHEAGNGVRDRVKFGPADLPRLDGLIADARDALNPEVRARPRTFYPQTSKGL